MYIVLELKSLNNSATISIIAPASSESKELVDEKIDIFKKLRFKIKKGKHLYNSYGYLAGTDKDRTDDLNSMLADKKVDAIVCLGGGCGPIRMVSYLDLKFIRSNSKPLCRYSNITLLLNYISKTCKFATFRGPMITSSFDDTMTKEYFLSVFTSKNSKIVYNLKNICGENYLVWDKQNPKGDTVEGNLSIICSTIRTPCEIDFKNNILLIEDVSESSHTVDRMLSQLVSRGKIQKLCGIIMGYFTDCANKDTDFPIDDIIKQKLLPLDISIIQYLPIGHNYPSVTIPIGSAFELLSDDDLLI